MREVVFVDAARTPFCKMGGALKTSSSIELGMLAVRNLLDKTGIESRGVVDTVMGGCGNLDFWTICYMRYLTLGVKLPLATSGSFVEMQEGSALASINHAAGKIALGFDDVIVVGGADSWSTKPAFMRQDLEPYKLIQPRAVEYTFSPYAEEALDHVAISDRIADRWDLSRAECDEHALWSIEKYRAACAAGYHEADVVPYVIPATRKTPEIIVTKDDVKDAAAISAMHPVSIGGTATEGNLAHYADGAAFLLMMSREMADKLGYKPIAKWVTGADVGCEPSLTGVAAAYANLKALKQAGLSMEDIAIWENNEISAAYDLCTMKEMARKTGKQIDRAKWNMHGSALAYGHANAANGARMAMSAMQLLPEKGRYAAISSSCAGGQGVTVILEKLNG